MELPDDLNNPKPGRLSLEKVTDEEYQKCLNCAASAVDALNKKTSMVFGQGKVLSKGANKRLRRSLAHSVMQSMRYQGVI